MLTNTALLGENQTGSIPANAFITADTATPIITADTATYIVTE